jgi:hypothetical protein
MRFLSLLLTLCMVSLTCGQQGCPNEIPAPYPLTILEEIPAAVKAAPDYLYQRWVEEHNQLQLARAKHFADQVQQGAGVIVTDYEFTSNQNLRSSRRGLIAVPDRQQERYKRTTTTYTPDRWGGGPVVILNPFCRE